MSTRSEHVAEQLWHVEKRIGGLQHALRKADRGMRQRLQRDLGNAQREQRRLLALREEWDRVREGR